MKTQVKPSNVKSHSRASRRIISYPKYPLNHVKLADAFYDENWNYFEKVFGFKPTSHLGAERMMNQSNMVDAYHKEDWAYFERHFGVKPENKLEARRLISEGKYLL